MKRTITKIFAALALILLCSPLAQAQWKEPADKKISEDQLKTYIATANDWFDEMRQIAEAAQAATTEAGKLAAVGDLDAKQKACLDRHHITKPEFDWVAQQVMDAYNYTTTVNDILRKSQDHLQQNLKENQDKLADANKRLALYQAAASAGTRVLSPEERDALIKSAKDDQQAAVDDAKQHQREAKTADAETAHHEADAKAADELAKNPPADIAPEDRPAYIKGKQDEAAAARDAAKDSRAISAESNKGAQDSFAIAASAANRAAHPEIPATDDEKASAKVDNDSGIAQAKQDIDSCQSLSARMTQFQAQLDETQKQFKANIPDENITLVTTHQAEIKQLLDHLKLLSTTRPSNQ